MEPVDTLISARWIVPVEPLDSILEAHSIAIRDGRIVAIVPTASARQRFDAAQTLDRPRHALLPGFVNAHTHSPMTLLRGRAEGLPLVPWLKDVIWPLERRWVDPEFVRDGAQLAIAEMLRAGVTCFGDMYFWPDVIAQTAAELHMRAAVGLIVIDAPTSWCSSTDEYFDKGLRVHDEYRGDPLIATFLAPHSPYAVSDESLRRIGRVADELELNVVTHLHESAEEVRESVERYGCRPLERLQRLGLATPQLVAVHIVHATAGDIAIVAESGASVVHCPESNLKLGSGVCRLPALRERGIGVAIGTDGAASNNDLDVLSELRTAGLLAAGVSGVPGAVPASELLRLATIEGARVLGLGDATGSLVPGKWADLCCIDLGAARSRPVHDVAATVVYSCSSSQVTDSWVAGRHVYGDGTLFYIDEAALDDCAESWRTRLGGGVLDYGGAAAAAVSL
jgi:5-methylthioadenosine/S-adenosylhomocysteine deaminase